MNVRNNNRLSHGRCLKCSSYVVVPYKPAKEGENWRFMALCITENPTLTLSIQVVAVRFTRRLITSDLIISLNQGFISPMGSLLSLILRIRSLGSYD